MKQEIYAYYANSLSAKKLVFKHMRFLWTCYIVFSTITFTCSIYFLSSNKIIKVFFMIALLGFFTGIINEKAKLILLKKYNIKPTHKKWANDAYMKMRQDLLKRYLIDKGVYTEKKLKELIDICYKEAERSKYKGYINWGVLLAVLIPLWTQFLASIFKISNSVRDSLNILGSIFMITIIIFSMIFLIKFVAQDIIDSFFNKKSNSFKQLAYVLEDILFIVDIEQCE